MNKHEGWRSDIPSFPTGEKSSVAGSTKTPKLKTTLSPPKKLLNNRSSARPFSYAAAASDTTSPSCPAPQFSTTTISHPRPQSISPPLSPRLTPPPTSLPPPLLSAEKIPRSVRSRSFFKLGMIIEAPLMEEDFMYGASLRRATATAAATSESSSMSTKAQREILSISASHYGYIHTKLRKFVVVGVFAQHYVALPMYTHNGEGLERKPDKGEYVNVRDARSVQPEDEEEEEERSLSGREVLVAEMRPESAKLYERTTVHVAYAVSRNYQLKVHFWGKLEAGSRERLLRLYREYVIRGTSDSE